MGGDDIVMLLEEADRAVHDAHNVCICHVIIIITAFQDIAAAMVGDGSGTTVHR